MKNKTSFCLSVFFLIYTSCVFLSGCNTVQGFGKDVQKLGGGSSEHTSTITTVETTEEVTHTPPK